MIASLEASGWMRIIDPAMASVIIVNTCGFIEPAKKESVDVLVSYRDAFPDAVLIAAGCLSQRYAGELAKSMPDLDGIFGNNSVSMISDFISEQAAGAGQLVKVPAMNEIDAASVLKDDELSINRKILLSGASTSFVKLAEGCSNNCSFCAIPLIRGGLRSRRPESVIEEIGRLTASGIGEINLIAQDLGSYGMDLEQGGITGTCLLPDLLSEIEKLPGDFIVRMLYIHPDKFPLEILDICSGSSRIVPYFDIPFQHASATVLAAMNRHGNAEKYLELLQTIRGKLPGAVIRTTFLVGFPGESKADVDELEAFIKAAKLEWAGFFSYSREEDTPAYELEGPRQHKRRSKTAEKNVERLQVLQTGITTEVFSRFIGRKLRLLVEEAVEKEDLYLCRAWMQAPEVDGLVVLHAKEGSLQPGVFVEADITGINGIDLEATLV
jgi:ribosomal protein S12 methylthiotransferase